MKNEGFLLMFVLFCFAIFLFLSIFDNPNSLTGYEVEGGSTNNPAYSPAYDPLTKAKPTPVEKTYALSDGKGGIFVGKGNTAEEAKANAQERIARGDKPDRTLLTKPNKYVPSPIKGTNDLGKVVGGKAKEFLTDLKNLFGDKPVVPNKPSTLKPGDLESIKIGERLKQGDTSDVVMPQKK